jgi:hypothetical protein
MMIVYEAIDEDLRYVSPVIKPMPLRLRVRAENLCQSGESNDAE